MVDWPLVVGGTLAIVPALGILMFSYSPYDGHFKDNILFLFFMAGIFSGMVMALFELLLLLPRGDALYTIGMVLVGIPLMEQLLKLLVLNRKKTQGDREATFYGGAFGLGFGTMMVLFMSQQTITLRIHPTLESMLGDPSRVLFLLVIGLSVLLAHFATGIIVGDGVRSRDVRWALVLAVGAMVPLQFFVFEFVASVQRGVAAEGLVYLPLMLAYTAGLAWWAQTRLLPKALPPEAQRKRRRALLRKMRDEPGA